MADGTATSSDGLLSPDAVSSCPEGQPSWWQEAFGDFAATLRSPEQDYPCVYAIRALRDGNLRMAFLSDPGAVDARRALADALGEYVDACHALTPYTAFLAFFGSDGPETRSFGDHAAEFWRVIQYLHENDPGEWPGHVPTDPDEPLWEFCFKGEPMFALAAGPVHQVRRSRQTSRFLISFQPRFMFDALGEEPELLERARKAIRERVIAMDGMPMHPMSLMYGDPDNREWRQYVMPEDNEPITGTCPFHHRSED